MKKLLFAALTFSAVAVGVAALLLFFPPATALIASLAATPLFSFLGSAAFGFAVAAVSLGAAAVNLGIGFAVSTLISGLFNYNNSRERLMVDFAQHTALVNRRLSGGSSFVDGNMDSPNNDNDFNGDNLHNISGNNINLNNDSLVSRSSQPKKNDTNNPQPLTRSTFVPSFPASDGSFIFSISKTSPADVASQAALKENDDGSNDDETKESRQESASTFTM